MPSAPPATDAAVVLVCLNGVRVKVCTAFAPASDATASYLPGCAVSGTIVELIIVLPPAAPLMDLIAQVFGLSAINSRLPVTSDPTNCWLFGTACTSLGVPETIVLPILYVSGLVLA